jgi:hypothetical protein
MTEIIPLIVAALVVLAYMRYAKRNIPKDRWPVDSISITPYILKEYGHKNAFIYFIGTMFAIMMGVFLTMIHFPWDTAKPVQGVGASIIMLAGFLIFIIGVFTQYRRKGKTGDDVKYWGHLVGSYGGIILGTLALPLAFAWYHALLTLSFFAVTALLYSRSKKGVTTKVELMAIGICFLSISIGILVMS